jgi:hypothetical protein
MFKDKVYKGSHCYDVLIKPKSKDPIKIGLYLDHYFINEESPFDCMSSDLIFKLFEQGLMKPMTVSDMPTQILEQPTFDDLSFNPTYCLREFNPIEDPITFEECIQNPKLIPRFAWSKFHDKCLRQCVQVGGIIKSYIKQAIRGGRIYCKSGEYSDLTLLDVNSLYPKALYNLNLPIGIPKIYTNNMDLTDTFAILTVNITSIKNPKPYYYKLATGRAVYDTIALNALVSRCGIEYDIITGYVWNVAESSEIKSYIDELYQLKSSSDGFERDFYKLCLNSPPGKCLRRATKTTKRKRFNTKNAALNYVMRNHHMLNRIEESEGKWDVLLNWCIDTTFNYSHIGIAILSAARAYMDTLFDECEALGIDIYYSHTDCIVIDTSKVALLKDWIGNKLGELKIEAQGSGYVKDKKHYRVGDHIRPRIK